MFRRMLASRILDGTIQLAHLEENKFKRKQATVKGSHAFVYYTVTFSSRCLDKGTDDCQFEIQIRKSLMTNNYASSYMS